MSKQPNHATTPEQMQLQMIGVETPKAYTFYEHQTVSTELHYYLSSEIGEPTEYVEMIHRIAVAAETDVIYIHLNTTGGQLDTGVQIINAMQTTEAHVVTILEGNAHSLGTMIFLAGDEMWVHENCMMMFHNFSGGVIGKGNELVRELEATVKWFNALVKTLYVPFLTEEELERILRGEDLWMMTPEIRERLLAVIALRSQPNDNEQSDT